MYQSIGMLGIITCVCAVPSYPLQMWFLYVPPIQKWKQSWSLPLGLLEPSVKTVTLPSAISTLETARRLLVAPGINCPPMGEARGQVEDKSVARVKFERADYTFCSSSSISQPPIVLILSLPYVFFSSLWEPAKMRMKMEIFFVATQWWAEVGAMSRFLASPFFHASGKSFWFWILGQHTLQDGTSDWLVLPGLPASSHRKVNDNPLYKLPAGERVAFLKENYCSSTC